MAPPADNPARKNIASWQCGQAVPKPELPVPILNAARSHRDHDPDRNLLARLVGVLIAGVALHERFRTI